MQHGESASVREGERVRHCRLTEVLLLLVKVLTFILIQIAFPETVEWYFSNAVSCTI